MKIVFLDFDGPIIPIMSHQLPHRVSGKGAQAFPSCVEQLNRITDSTGAVIVVSSTWRADGITRTRERLHVWGARADCIGVTPYMNERDPQTGFFLGVQRGREIQKWLDEYDREEVKSFVILDDDNDMVHLAPRLVLTPVATGLTEHLADKSIELLNAGLGRCEICDWPLKAAMRDGCILGNCSYRPHEHTEEWYRIQQRRAAVASKGVTLEANPQQRRILP